jgi:hypothetical protein
MHNETSWIDKALVQTTFDIGDAAMHRATPARPLQERHLVGQFVADQREGSIEQIREVDLGRPDAGGNALAVEVHRLDDEKVIAQVHASAPAAADAHRTALRAEPPVVDRNPPHLLRRCTDLR